MNNKITGLLFYGENKLRENDRYFRYREKQSGSPLEILLHVFPVHDSCSYSYSYSYSQ